MYRISLLVGLLILAAGTASAEVLVDFSRPNAWRLRRGRNPDAQVGALQTRLCTEGTVIHLDASKAKDPVFASVGVGYADGVEIGGTGRVVRLVTRQCRPSPVRQNPGPGLLLTDKTGEHYQYMPVEVCSAGETVTYVYRLVEKGFRDRPWAGDGNRQWDPPMKVTEFFFSYDSDASEGDVTLVRLEVADEGVLVSSRETLLGCEQDKDIYTYRGGWVRYASFPGPKPFRGPDEVLVRTEPSFKGRVRLKVRNMHSRAECVFETDWDGETVFKTHLHSSETYEFVCFEFFSAALKTKSFELKSVEGRFLQTEAEACRLDVETGSSLHLLTTDDVTQPVVTFRNPTDRNLHWDGELVFSDCLGHAIRQPLDLNVSSGQVCRFPLQQKLPTKGLWNVSAEIRAGDGSRAYPSTRFARIDPHVVTPHLSDGKFRLGINYHYCRYSPKDKLLTLDALVSSGAKLGRVDFGTRAKVETGPGARDWADTDEGVERFWQRGIALDAICWGQPKWAAMSENRANPHWQTWYLRMPEDRDLTARYYQDMAARYGCKIAYYEIGNEWDLTFPGPVEEAIEIQKLCYSSLKKGNPDVTVIPNGWARWDSESPRIKPEKRGFPETMTLATRGCYDVHPVHIHGLFAEYRRELTERFLRRRTEMGVDNVPWYSNETALTSVHGNELAVAEHIWMKIPFAWAYGSRDYIWYNLKGTGWNPNDPEQGYGLMTADYYPRAGYAAFAALATLLSGFDFREILKSEKTREVFCFSGRRMNRDEIVVLGWDVALEMPGELSFETDAEKVLLVDIMGNETNVTLKGGRCVWPLAKRPTALRFIGATVVTPDRIELDAIPAQGVRPVVVGVGEPRGRLPDLTVDSMAFVHCFYDANPATVHRTWQGPSDASFKVWVGRSPVTLTFLVHVRDDVHCPSSAADTKMTEGDCLRMDLKVSGCDEVFKLGFRLAADGKSESCICSGPREAGKKIRHRATRREDMTIYEISIPLEPFSISDRILDEGGVKVLFNVDDDDGEGRDLWIGMDALSVLSF